MSNGPHESVARFFGLLPFDRRAGDGPLLVGVVAKTLAVMIQRDAESPDLRFAVVQIGYRATQRGVWPGHGLDPGNGYFGGGDAKALGQIFFRSLHEISNMLSRQSIRPVWQRAFQWFSTNDRLLVADMDPVRFLTGLQQGQPAMGDDLQILHSRAGATQAGIWPFHGRHMNDLNIIGLYGKFLAQGVDSKARGGFFGRRRLCRCCIADGLHWRDGGKYQQDRADR